MVTFTILDMRIIVFKVDSCAELLDFFFIDIISFPHPITFSCSKKSNASFLAFIEKVIRTCELSANELSKK
jgi:hypothetical protein